MNVTLGVPRIKEIINAAKVISTPIISCKLVTSDSEPSARIVKGRLEKTHLGDVASVLEEAWAPEYTYLGVIVDVDAIQKLQVRVFPSLIIYLGSPSSQLELTLDDIKWAIVAAKKLKIKQEVECTFRCLCLNLTLPTPVDYHHTTTKSASDLYRWSRQVLPSARTKTATSRRSCQGVFCPQTRIIIVLTDTTRVCLLYNERSSTSRTRMTRRAKKATRSY